MPTKGLPVNSVLEYAKGETFSNSDPRNAIRGVTFSTSVGAIMQLIALSNNAHSIFSNLNNEIQTTFTRLETLKERTRTYSRIVNAITHEEGYPETFEERTQFTVDVFDRPLQLVSGPQLKVFPQPKYLIQKYATTRQLPPFRAVYVSDGVVYVNEKKGGEIIDPTPKYSNPAIFTNKMLKLQSERNQQLEAEYQATRQERLVRRQEYYEKREKFLRRVKALGGDSSSAVSPYISPGKRNRFERWKSFQEAMTVVDGVQKQGKRPSYVEFAEKEKARAQRPPSMSLLPRAPTQRPLPPAAASSSSTAAAVAPVSGAPLGSPTALLAKDRPRSNSYLALINEQKKRNQTQQQQQENNPAEDDGHDDMVSVAEEEEILPVEQQQGASIVPPSPTRGGIVGMISNLLSASGKSLSPSKSPLRTPSKTFMFGLSRNPSEKSVNSRGSPGSKKSSSSFGGSKKSRSAKGSSKASVVSADDSDYDDSGGESDEEATEAKRLALARMDNVLASIVNKVADEVVHDMTLANVKSILNDPAALASIGSGTPPRPDDNSPSKRELKRGISWKPDVVTTTHSYQVDSKQAIIDNIHVDATDGTATLAAPVVSAATLAAAAAAAASARSSPSHSPKTSPQRPIRPVPPAPSGSTTAAPKLSMVEEMQLAAKRSSGRRLQALEDAEKQKAENAKRAAEEREQRVKDVFLAAEEARQKRAISESARSVSPDKPPRTDDAPQAFTPPKPTQSATISTEAVEVKIAAPEVVEKAVVEPPEATAEDDIPSAAPSATATPAKFGAANMAQKLLAPTSHLHDQNDMWSTPRQGEGGEAVDGSPRIETDDVQFGSPRVVGDEIQFGTPRVTYDDAFGTPRVTDGAMIFSTPRVLVMAGSDPDDPPPERASFDSQYPPSPIRSSFLTSPTPKRPPRPATLGRLSEEPAEVLSDSVVKPSPLVARRPSKVAPGAATSAVSTPAAAGDGGGGTSRASLSVPSSSRTSPYKALLVLCPGGKIPVRSAPTPKATIISYVSSGTVIVVAKKSVSGYYLLADYEGYVNKWTKKVEWVDSELPEKYWNVGDGRDTAVSSKSAVAGSEKSAAVTGGGPKCPGCARSVYAAESITLMQRMWHKTCFVCGGASQDTGCRKVLTLHTYVDHDGDPFCKACYELNFGRKGYDSTHPFYKPDRVKK